MITHPAPIANQETRDYQNEHADLKNRPRHLPSDRQSKYHRDSAVSPTKIRLYAVTRPAFAAFDGFEQVGVGRARKAVVEGDGGEQVSEDGADDGLMGVGLTMKIKSTTAYL